MSETKEQQSSDALPEAHFEGEASPPDWRAEDQEDEDPDDEEVDTPDDVIMMLGFDPAEDEDERLDAEFEESDHPRDQTGRFAQTAEGAAAGRDYHLGEEKKWLEKREGTVYRPHRRAAAAYEEARGHYEKGLKSRGQAAHREAESHGGAAERRAARISKDEKKPEPLSKEKVASNSVFETIDELDKGGAPDERYRQILSTSSKTTLKFGETWRDRAVRFAESLGSEEKSTASVPTKSENPIPKIKGEIEPDEEEAITNYTGDGHLVLNAIARVGVDKALDYLEERGRAESQTKATIRANAADVPLLNDVISRSKTTKDGVLFRGVGSGNHLKNLKPGDEYEEKGFTSLTTSKSTAEKFGRQAVIHVPKGSSLLKIPKDMQAEPEKGITLDEGEHLLGSGTIFVVEKNDADGIVLRVKGKSGRTDAQLYTQESAHYTVAGTVEEHCGICEHFEAPTACARIEGPVVFSGWCRLFEKK